MIIAAKSEVSFILQKGIESTAGLFSNRKARFEKILKTIGHICLHIYRYVSPNYREPTHPDVHFWKVSNDATFILKLGH